jgi:hypothetical protein
MRLTVQPETTGPLPRRDRFIGLDVLVVVVHRLTSLLPKQQIYDQASPDVFAS